MNSRMFKIPQNPAAEKLKKFLEEENTEENAECCQRIKANKPTASRMKKGM